MHYPELQNVQKDTADCFPAEKDSRNRAVSGECVFTDRQRERKLKMKKQIISLILMACLILCLNGAAADPDISLQDTSVRSGSWADVYTAILAERSADIVAYQDYVQSITDIPTCHPVDLLDLTGDGIPELLFLALIDETEYRFKVGQLRIYTSDGNSVHCVLTLQPEIDDLLYSRYYLAKTGMLTIHFADCEMGWTLQFLLNLNGYYTAENTLIEQADFSGEGPDYYFQNGKKVSAKAFRSLMSQIQADQGTMIGSLMVDEGGSGFTYTLAEALEVLASGSDTAAAPGDGGITVNGMSPSGGQLPDLSFFLGSFTAGQKFAVYSAPSARSWRGAKGKAAITSGSEIYVAGTEDEWILIIYELNSGVVRVGYVDSRKIEGQYTSGDALSFSQIPMTLTESTVMTDDPIRQKTTISKLKKGTQVTCLAEYRGWIYVEAKVSGKTARGFIEPSSLGWGE